MERGLRQGDPLSPFLFLLAADCFNVLMKAVVEEGLYRGYQVGRQDGVIIFVLIIFIFDVVVKADEAIEKVNLWVKKETRGLIKNILSPGSIDRFTSVVLANALYFKGA